MIIGTWYDFGNFVFLSVLTEILLFYRGVMAERVNILKTDYEMDRTDWTQVVSAVFGGMLHVQDMIEMYVANGQGWTLPHKK